MNDLLHLMPIILPIAGGILALGFPRRGGNLCGWSFAAVTLANLLVVIRIFGGGWTFSVPWGGFDFALRLYSFSSFILLASAGFGFLLGVYSVAFMRGKQAANQYYSYFLLTVGGVNGAVLADNLVLMLFFWESLLLTLFGMIVIGRPGAFRTAVKAFAISGTADLCMMVGVGLTIHLAHNMSMSAIHLPLDKAGSAAFIMLMIGAIAKAGAMPFHSWIPDAALDAPAPFMALVPAALEKLLGIYLLARISLDLFQFNPGAWISPLLMVIGCITILLAVMMALVQKDYKRLLSFHAISQVGYMILGIGTAVPIGIVGGIFHMINHAMYKSCLFLTGGAVEKQAGTTDLSKLGGLSAKMPVTFACFCVAAASISGVPPFNGFFSKELVYDGALARGAGYYAIALLGSFLTAASFLKLGHSAFADKPRSDVSKVTEAPLSMLLPMLTIAGLCILFGVWNALPLRHLVEPVLGAARMEGHSFAGWPHSKLLVILTVVVLVFAVLHHLWGARRAGSGLGAADHIHHAPVLGALYAQAEAGHFDPYEIGLKLVAGLARVAWWIDRGIDFIYNRASVSVAAAFSYAIRISHTGSHAAYLLWALAGVAVIVILMLGGN